MALRFKQSLDTQELVKRLREVEVGEEVRYTELDKLIGRDARTHGLQTARREMLREGRVFGVITGKGLKRLKDAETVDMAAGGVRRINRMAKRGIQVLAAADYEKLTQGEKLRHATHMTVFTLAASNTGAASMQRIEQAVNSTQSAIPAAKAALLAVGGIDDKKK